LAEFLFWQNKLNVGLAVIELTFGTDSQTVDLLHAAPDIADPIVPMGRGGAVEISI
jgi:hypothetical protein